MGMETVLLYVRENFMEIFSLVTGMVYVILEVRQKNFMWILGMFTSAATVYVFFRQGLYASSVLNVYYFVIAFWGLYQWRKDSRAIREHSSGDHVSAESDIIHLNKISPSVLWISLAVFLSGTAVLMAFMKILGDPVSLLDASVSMLSAVATWWLGKSYLQQWLLWVAANLLTLVMCMTQGLYLMSVLYAAYTAFAMYGYFHWKRHGRLAGR